MSFVSWKDKSLPNILWAVCLRGNFDQQKSLSLFHKVILRFSERFHGRKDVTLCHNSLASFSDQDFQYVFQDLLKDADASACLSALSLIESLPDARHWRQFFPNKGSDTDAWETLSLGLIVGLDHQSQESTDVRWLKVASFCLIGKLKVPSRMADEIRDYPNFGDQRKVRPMIRATELSFRDFEEGSGKDPKMVDFSVEDFWLELFEKTPCILATPEPEKRIEPVELQQKIGDALSAVSEHFMASIGTTNLAARLDGGFGLSLHALSLCLEVALSPSNRMAGGRILLRSIVEAFITLKYLANADDPTLWLQYRNYGAGQTALAFIKSSDADEWPAFIDEDKLEMLANEDIWHEMRDIDLGSWANMDLRKMSISAGVKDVYDKYYDWTSGFSHGHWGCVRDANLTTCLNPLHRLHRLPSGLSDLPEVLEDCCKVCNRILDLLEYLYPGLKKRIDWKTKP